MLSEFDECVTVRRLKNRSYIFECKKGLWSTESRSLPNASREAQNYFWQYKMDGEYSDIIGGPTTAEVLMSIVRNKSE